jgi:hypothetical protein
MVTTRQNASVAAFFAAFFLATFGLTTQAVAQAPSANHAPDLVGAKPADKPTETAPSDQAPADAKQPENAASTPQEPAAGAASQTNSTSTASAVPPVKPGPLPRVYHAAVYSASPSESLDIGVSFGHPELIRQAVLVMETAGGVERIIAFKRSDASVYVATIPAELMKAPGIAYAIEIEHVNGSRIAAFASRAVKHPVTIIEDITDTRERALLARLGGRRSILSVGGEYVGFGRNVSSQTIPCGQKQTECAADTDYIPTIDEHYYRIEAGYTYRSLRTVSEFGFRLGVLRGRSLKPLQVYESDKYDVGLNFGAARVRFRLLDLWQFEGELLTSITEEGFSSGFNFATHIGDPYGTKLILGFERLGLTGVTFGNRIYSRMDIVAGSRLLVSPIIEITDMPNARTFGVRLLAELSFKISDGFSAQLRGGYQARKFDSGGPGIGGSLSYAF